MEIKTSAGEDVRYRVWMTLPTEASGQFRQLFDALVRSDPHITCGMGPSDGCVPVWVFTRADNAEAAQAHAVDCVAAALAEVGREQLTPRIEVRAVVGSSRLPGGLRRLDTAPPLGYRTTTLPDGRRLNAAFDAPLGDWYAYLDEDPGRVLAGREVQLVLNELLLLPQWEPWILDTVAQVAGRRTPDGVRYACPCCDHLTLRRPPTTTFDICLVCRWEDDDFQFRDPNAPSGANSTSLRQARENYRSYGACDEHARANVRPPAPYERP